MNWKCVRESAAGTCRHFIGGSPARALLIVLAVAIAPACAGVTVMAGMSTIRSRPGVSYTVALREAVGPKGRLEPTREGARWKVEDGGLSVAWGVSPTDLDLLFENRTNDTIEIVWADSTLARRNAAARLVPSHAPISAAGIGYTRTGQVRITSHVAPSPVAPRTTIRFPFHPADAWEEQTICLPRCFSSLQKTPVIPVFMASTDSKDEPGEIKSSFESQKEDPLTLTLTVRRDGALARYSFRFEIVDASVRML